MRYGANLILGYLFGTDIAGRDLAVYSDDTFLVSFPRSGSTWTRFLIANLVHPEIEVSFANLERLIPDTSSQSNRRLKQTPRPRLIKSHEYFDPRYRRVMYIVRDPRDVVLSYYDFQRKYRHFDDSFSLDQYVTGFIQGTINHWGTWGTWAENVNSWLATRSGSEDFLLLRYEDMKDDTPRELERIARFLGIEPAPERLTRAIQLSSADRMRKLEQAQSDQWVATRNKRNDIPFVGGAEAGAWRTELSAKSIAEIENAWGGLMRSLGYELQAVETGATPSPLTPILGTARK